MNYIAKMEGNSCRSQLSLGRLEVMAGLSKKLVNTSGIGDWIGSQVYVGRALVGKDSRPESKSQNRCQERSRTFGLHGLINEKDLQQSIGFDYRITLKVFGIFDWHCVVTSAWKGPLYFCQTQFSLCETMELFSCPFRDLCVYTLKVRACMCLLKMSSLEVYLRGV